MSFPPELLDELASVTRAQRSRHSFAALSEGNIEESTQETNDPPWSDDRR